MPGNLCNERNRRNETFRKSASPRVPFQFSGSWCEHGALSRPFYFGALDSSSSSLSSRHALTSREQKHQVFVSSIRSVATGVSSREQFRDKYPKRLWHFFAFLRLWTGGAPFEIPSKSNRADRLVERKPWIEWSLRPRYSTVVRSTRRMNGCTCLPC